jgi:hypothetical protein
MKQIKLAQKLALIAILIITIIFLSILSPLKGLSILTPLAIVLGITIWGYGLIVLVLGLRNRKKENFSDIKILTAIILICGFIPIGILFMKISGKARTRITIEVVNQSERNPSNISIFGSGIIFENSDTLKLKKLNKGESLTYTINAISKPHRSGYIKMEFDLDKKHISKNIAGEFSVNPYVIKQQWRLIIDDSFYK